jgi:hypothetical protein
MTVVEGAGPVGGAVGSAPTGCAADAGEDVIEECAVASLDRNSDHVARMP